MLPTQGTKYLRWNHFSLLYSNTVLPLKGTEPFKYVCNQKTTFVWVNKWFEPSFKDGCYQVLHHLNHLKWGQSHFSGTQLLEHYIRRNKEKTRERRGGPIVKTGGQSTKVGKTRVTGVHPFSICVNKFTTQ